MSKRVTAWPVLVAATLMAACDQSPVAPALDATTAESVVATRDVPTPTRDGTATRRHRDPQDRIAAAARAAIDDAQHMLARAAELADRDSRPAILEAIGEARQLIEQAIGAYQNGDFSRAYVKAQNAIELLSLVLRALG